MVVDRYELTRNEQVNVISTSSVVADARGSNVKRIVYSVRNTSGDGSVITVKQGFGLAVASSGIVLKDGEGYTDSSESGYECYQGSVSAISTTSTGKLSIMERCSEGDGNGF